MEREYTAGAALPRKRLSLTQWLASIRGQRVIISVTFLAAPIFLLVLFIYFPFGKMIEFSLYEMKYIGARKFIGLANYKDVFTRKEILSSLLLSLYYLVASFVQLALALYFACVLSTKLKGGAYFKGILFFPYLVCGIAVGFIFKFFFTPGFVLDTALGWLGFSQDILPYWLRDAGVNNIMLAGTSVWRYMGQNMVLFIGAIMAVDPDLYESADIDGATGWNKFLHIMLPGIRTIVVLNLILSISGSISAFEPPYVITRGTFGTSTFFVTMSQMAHEKQKVGLAAAMAVVLMLVIILVTLLQQFINKYFFEEDKNGLTYRERRIRREHMGADLSKGGRAK